jgi:hypothetical protein
MQWLHIKDTTSQTWKQSNFPITMRPLAIYASFEGNIAYSQTNTDCLHLNINQMVDSFYWTKTTSNYLWVFAIGY